MQHKNLSNPSVAKAVQDKKTFTYRNSGGSTFINDERVSKYTSGSTFNCQIGSLVINNDELFSEFLNSKDEFDQLNIFSTILGQCSSNRRMLSLTYRTRLLDELVKKNLCSRRILSESIIFNNRQKFTNLLIVL